MRLGSAEVVNLPAFALNLLQLALRLFGDAGTKGEGDVVLLVVFVLQGFPLGVQGFQLAIGLPGGGVGLLPVQVQGFQGFGRFAGSQSAQFGAAASSAVLASSSLPSAALASCSLWARSRRHWRWVWVVWCWR